MSDDDGDESYELAMPFVSVRSKGGPHDDESYVAGYQMGLLDAQLGGSEFDQGRPIAADSREQADLIAMRHGYIAEFTANISGWVCMRVRKADADE